MEQPKPKVKEFLNKSKELLKDAGEPSFDTAEFVEVLKRENTRQIKEQLATDLEPLLNHLVSIEKHQTTIIELLKKKLDLDVYEKEIYDLVKAKVEKE